MIHTHREEVQYPGEQHYREYHHSHEINASAHFHEYAWTGTSANSTVCIPMNRGHCKLTSRVTREVNGE